MSRTDWDSITSEFCLVCGGDLPPLNGVEDNDFAYVCEECRVEGAE